MISVKIKPITAEHIYICETGEANFSSYIRFQEGKQVTWAAAIGGNTHKLTDGSTIYELESAYQFRLKEDFKNDKDA